MTERFARAAAALGAAGPSGHEQILTLAAEHGIEITRPLADLAQTPGG